jgi:hypothetical protein
MFKKLCVAAAAVMLTASAAHAGAVDKGERKDFQVFKDVATSLTMIFSTALPAARSQPLTSRHGSPVVASWRCPRLITPRSAQLFSRQRGRQESEFGFHIHRIRHGLRNLLAEQVASRLPNCRAHFVENEGHYSLPIRHVREILADLWTSAGGDIAALDAVTLTGDEPQLPSSFRVAAAAQTSIAAAGLAAAQIWQLRTGQSQDVAVDMRHAVVECRSERYLRVDGKPPPPAWDAIAGIYRTRDQRFVRLHTNFPHHRAAVCQRNPLAG